MASNTLQHDLYQGDCLSVMPTLGQFDCVFADPFDNIGLGYDEHKDKMPDGEYIAFLRDLVYECGRHAPILWFSFNAKWTFAMGRIFTEFLSDSPAWEGKPCQQVFTFGQHNKNDLGNNHRPLWRLKRKDAPLYPEQIKVPSWRQRNGDKRAAPGGRVPGDVLDMQYPPGDWSQPGDVLDFPRVTGNSKQRCDWHPTQLHEELVERCLKLSTPEYGTVLDPFGGTGTTLRACKTINRSCTLIEMSAGYCGEIRAAHPDLKCFS